MAIKLTKNNAKTLVIGFGNTLREDDGFGPSVVDRLPDHLPIERLCLHQLTPELCESVIGFEKIGLIDINAENAAGVFAVPLPSAQSVSGHEFTPWHLMAYVEQLYRQKKEFEIFSAGGYSYEHREELSPIVEKSAKSLSAFLTETLAN